MRYAVFNKKIDEDGQTETTMSEIFDNGSDALLWFHQLVDKQVSDWGGGDDGSLNPQVSVSKSVDCLRYTVSFDLDGSVSIFYINGLDDDSPTIIQHNLKEEELKNNYKFLVVYTPELNSESMNLYYGESIFEAWDAFESKLSTFDKYKDQKGILITDGRTLANVSYEALSYVVENVDTKEKCGCYVERREK